MPVIHNHLVMLIFALFTACLLVWMLVPLLWRNKPTPTVPDEARETAFEMLWVKMCDEVGLQHVYPDKEHSYSLKPKYSRDSYTKLVAEVTSSGALRISMKLIHIYGERETLIEQETLLAIYGPGSWVSAISSSGVEHRAPSYL